MDTLPDSLRRQVAALRVIVIALATGALLFPSVVLAALEPRGHEPGIISAVATFAALSALVFSGVVPGLMLRQARPRIAAGTFEPGGGAAERADARAAGTEGQLFSVYRASAVVGSAMLEFGSLFATVAYLIEGYRWMLVPAFGLPLVILALRMPTERGVAAFLARETRRLEA
jgi:hypothetical protein